MKNTLLLKGIRLTKEHLEKEEKRIREELKELQENCPHSNAVRKNRGDCGNILTGRDPSYWVHCSCPDCGKVWTEDQ